MPNWQTVGKYLGMGGEDIGDIEQNHLSDAERRKAVTRQWIHKRGNKATYRVLYDVLIKLGEQGAADHLKSIAGNM